MGLDALDAVLPAMTDRVTLVAVRAYLRLKRGEVWAELEQELHRDGVLPVEVCHCLRPLLQADAELLAHVRSVHWELVRRVRGEQGLIVEECVIASTLTLVLCNENWPSSPAPMLLLSPLQYQLILGPMGLTDS
jgi:hypothetical protein